MMIMPMVLIGLYLIIAVMTTSASYVNYLARFGYLPTTADGSLHQLSADTVRSALQRLQQFAGLNATGELDDGTRQLLAMKRCGMADGQQQTGNRRRRRYVLQGPKWSTTNLTYRVVNTAHSLPEHGAIRRVIFNALNAWQKVSVLEFRESAHADADIQISFASREHGDNTPFDGQDIVLAHAFYPANGLGGDVHLDDDERWTDQLVGDPYRREVSMPAVIMHELGHSLGLSHSQEHDSIMYPYYQYTTDHGASDTLLHYDDIVAIQALYGAGDRIAPTRPPTTSPRPSTQPTPTTIKEEQSTSSALTPPDLCNSPIDAITCIRQEVFVFKDRWFWRLSADYQLNERPVQIDRFWPELTADGARIDAVYERKLDSTIIFFVGNKIYRYNGTSLMHGYPHSLTHIGLPDSLTAISAAFIWEYNQATYLFADDEYWRLDETIEKVEIDYPRRVRLNWHGVPTRIDAAFTDHHDETYFFKYDRVYKFNGALMKVARGYPKQLHDFWSFCRPPKTLTQFAHLRSAATNGGNLMMLITLLLFNSLLPI